MFCLWILSCKIGELDKSDHLNDALDQSTIYHQAATQFLIALRMNEQETLMDFVHPIDGIRFSPIPRIDTMIHNQLSKDSIISLFESNKKIYWGLGFLDRPIESSITEYFNTYVRSANFLRADHVNHNNVHMENKHNHDKIYPNLNYIDYYCKGSDYFGLNWRSLRLVFKNHIGKPYLVAIVHEKTSL